MMKIVGMGGANVLCYRVCLVPQAERPTRIHVKKQSDLLRNSLRFIDSALCLHFEYQSVSCLSPSRTNSSNRLKSMGFSNNGMT